MNEQDNANNAPETVVGPSVKIQGDLNSEGNIKVEGQVSGKIRTTQSVYVGESAKIMADVAAGSAQVAGEVQGNLKISGNLVLQATAKVTGDISCAVLRVEDGALFTGKCSMQGTPEAIVKNGKQKSPAEPELEE